MFYQRVPFENEKGYADIHVGVHGIGDLPPEVRDWRNPVVRVAIRRVSGRAKEPIEAPAY